MPTIILHIQNEDAVLGEVDALPGVGDSLIMLKNPRKRDGKDLSYIDASVTTVLWPIHRVVFIELLPTASEEEIITFVRE